MRYLLLTVVLPCLLLTGCVKSSVYEATSDPAKVSEVIKNYRPVEASLKKELKKDESNSLFNAPAEGALTKLACCKDGQVILTIDDYDYVAPVGSVIVYTHTLDRSVRALYEQAKGTMVFQAELQYKIRVMTADDIVLPGETIPRKVIGIFISGRRDEAIGYYLTDLVQGK